MINNLLGQNGIRAAQIGADTWTIAGQGEDLAKVQKSVERLSVQVSVLNARQAVPGPKGDTGNPGPSGPPGPTGSGVNYGTALLDFGVFPGATEKSVTVLDAGVTAASLIQCWPAIKATADHTTDELYLEEFAAESSSIAAGSFVLLARPRRGLSFGRYQFNYLYV